MSPPVIPDYTLLRPIGRGAYGEVWLARNVMGTLRAIKIVWRRQFESDRPFEREFAGIQHYEPVSLSSGGLVHVLHVGRNDVEGYFFYVMELADAAPTETIQSSVSGVRSERAKPPASSPPNAEDSNLESYVPRTLRSDLASRHSLAVADSLRLAIDVISGLAQLHRHGLVHRDVKPGNIIYVSGRAKLADIGLVSAGGESRTFVGTEGYIPPEGPGTPAADLFALGMVLYEASTSFAPERFPDVPSSWFTTPTGSAALEFHEVILKACEGQRERRYRNAEEMQADLALLQSGESVRQIRAMKRRFARLRWGVGVGLALLGCAVAAAVFANYRAKLAAESRAKEALLREQAQSALARTEVAELEARRQLYAALLEQAKATVRSGELGQRVKALDAVRRAGAISNTAALRGAALAALALPDLRHERDWPRPPEVTLALLDPSFERIAWSLRDGPTEIHSTRDWHLLGSLPASTNAPCYIGGWSPDGRFLWLRRNVKEDGEYADVEVWEVGPARRILLLHEVEHDAAAFHPRLPRLMAAFHDGAVVTWDLESAREIARLRFSDTPKLVAWSPDGERFAASYYLRSGGAVAVHRTSDGARLLSQPLADFCGAIDWHPGGRWLAVAGHDTLVWLIDTESGEALVLGRHKAQAVLAKFSPDGEYVMSGGWERDLILWSPRQRQPVFTAGLNSFRAQFRADGGECAIIGDDRIQFHAFERPSSHREMAEDLGPRLGFAAFSRDGRWLAASSNQRLGVWDLNQENPGAVEVAGSNLRPCFSGGGDLFAVGDDQALRWRIRPAPSAGLPPTLERAAIDRPAGIRSLCIVSNRILLTAAQGTGGVPVDDAAASVRGFARTADGVSGVSPDGRWLGIYEAYSYQLDIHRLPGLEPVVTLTNRGSISGFQFSPGSDEVAVASRAGVQLWDTATWNPRREWTNVVGVLYLPDGRTWWVQRDYRTAALCRVHSIDPLLPLPLGTLPLAVSPDGRKLAVSVDARRLQVWDLAEVRRQLRELGLDWSE